MADVMDSFGRFEESQRIHRMEMLAELFYIDADLHTGPQRDDLLNRALTLFRYIDSHSDTFSFDRLNKINRLEKSLNTN